MPSSEAPVILLACFERDSSGKDMAMLRLVGISFPLFVPLFDESRSHQQDQSAIRSAAMTSYQTQKTRWDFQSLLVNEQGE